MPISAEAARARGRLANASLRRDPEALEAARRDLRAAVLADRIKQAVAAAPPFTADQRASLAGLLTEGVADV